MYCVVCLLCCFDCLLCVAGLGSCSPGPDHRHVSYLPLAHMLERIICLSVVAAGARVLFNADKEVRKQQESVADELREKKNVK
jgi:long-subunit acyl-CoA synthetase (AMP-forming)